MSSKALAICIVLCVLGSCWGEEEAKRELSRLEDTSPSEPLGAPTDPDLSKDASFWRFWKFWKWGRSMLQKVISRSSDIAKSVSTGRHRIHEDRPNGKIKNKRPATKALLDARVNGMWAEAQPKFQFHSRAIFEDRKELISTPVGLALHLKTVYGERFRRKVSPKDFHNDRLVLSASSGFPRTSPGHSSTEWEACLCDVFQYHTIRIM